ncbi:hypothetical protein B0H17DRAFT_1134917 [Mycena rosella]|uniref:Uncharacterized protein n=1 Tax=Mycena rosella TaxID=1033263 RepID=A0AAD7GDI2_MYCRO|nr:hypothetical protein B0H17DRAFT_1134917 [Mycena rosella]
MSTTTKHIRPIPGLINELAEISPAQINSLSSAGVQLPDPDNGFPTSFERSVDELPITAIDAEAVAKQLDFVLVNWWTRGGHSRVREYLALQENYGLEFLNHSGDLVLDETLWEALDIDIKANVKEVARRFHALANWQILAPSPESDFLIQDLGRSVHSTSPRTLAGIKPAASCLPAPIADEDRKLTAESWLHAKNPGMPEFTWLRNARLNMSRKPVPPKASANVTQKQMMKVGPPTKKLYNSLLRAEKETEPRRATNIASARGLALIYVNYGIFNSSGPASFVHTIPSLVAGPAKSAYNIDDIDEYFDISPDSEISAGAAGIAHEATLRVTSTDGGPLLENVVKVAFLAEQQKRMRHEHAIYRHMAESHVKGIPEVYGIFEDLEGGAMVLIMSACGGGTRIGGVAEFIEIHAAGVYHHDIRAENLMLTTKGEAIIDFSRSELHSTKGKKRREITRLCDLLDGSHPDLSIPSPTTFRDSQAAGSEKA